MNKFARIKVQQTETGPNTWRVWLNDEEITDQCMVCNISFRGGDITIASLELLVSEVNAPSGEEAK